MPFGCDDESNRRFALPTTVRLLHGDAPLQLRYETRPRSLDTTQYPERSSLRHFVNYVDHSATYFLASAFHGSKVTEEQKARVGGDAMMVVVKS